MNIHAADRVLFPSFCFWVFPHSNFPPVKLVLSAVLVHQFGIASHNIPETHHYLLMFLDDVLRHSCLLVINIPATL